MKKFFILADDDIDDAELFSDALAEIIPGVDFYHTDDCRALLRYLSNGENRKPDLIFLDINMPEMNGWECLGELKKHAENKYIPVIMYSTSSTQRDKEMAMELEAVGFLTKPSDFRVLVKMLTAIAHARDQIDLSKVLQML
jgi:CheY-like chemotaxis protein